MVEFQSDRPDFAEIDRGTADAGPPIETNYDGVVADATPEGFDIDDDALPDSETTTVELERLYGRPAYQQEARAGGGVAVLERTLVIDAFGEIDREQGRVYRGSTWEPTDSGEPATDSTGGRPPVPPGNNPGSGSSEFGDESGDDDPNDVDTGSVPTVPLHVFDQVSAEYPALSQALGDASEPGIDIPRAVEVPEFEIPDATSPFEAFTPATHPDSITPEPARMAFEPETDMLRRFEIMTRVGQLVTFREGAQQGRDLAAKRAIAEDRAARAAELAHPTAEPAAPDQPPVAEPAEVQPPAADTGAIEMIIDTAEGTARFTDVPEAATEHPEPQIDHLPTGRDVPAVNPWNSSADDDTLRRIIAGIRGASGQVDATIKEQAGTIDPSELTPQELADAGGDVTIAIANRAAQMRAEQRETGDQ